MTEKGRKLDKEAILKLKKEYPVGTIVRAIDINDPYVSLPVGIKGKVLFVDNSGTICVKWNNGRIVGIIHGVDQIEKINKKEG